VGVSTRVTVGLGGDLSLDTLVFGRDDKDLGHKEKNYCVEL